MHNSIIGILCKEGRVKADKNISERRFLSEQAAYYILHTCTTNENYNCDLAAYYTLNACITTALLSIIKKK